ncbi:MAG: DUF3180 domain-containing protein [Pseudonocardia sp.]
MKVIGARQLLPLFGALAVVVYLAVGSMYSTLPALPTPAGAPLLVLAAAEVIMAHGLRTRIERRPGARPVQPLQAARAVALAQASALTGAIMAGIWLGLLGYLLPRRDELASAAEDTPAAVIGLVSAVALVAAALWLQHCCRTPPENDDLDRPRRGS